MSHREHLNFKPNPYDSSELSASGTEETNILQQRIMHVVSHSTIGVLFFIRDTINSGHNLVRGGIICDDPLNMASQGLFDTPEKTDDVLFLFNSNAGNSG